MADPDSTLPTPLNQFKNGMFQVSLKVNRAYRHIQEINACVEALAKDDFCRIVEERDPETGQQSFHIVFLRLPTDVPFSIGDAIHNLNCALDYIATAIMRACGKDVNRIVFPSDETRKALKSTFKRPAPGRGKPRNRAIVEACPKFALLLLCKIQPYRGGNFGVWEVRKADNLDKHNLIIPTVALTGLTDIKISDKRNNTLEVDTPKNLSLFGVIGDSLY